MIKNYSLIFIAFLCFSLFGYGQTTIFNASGGGAYPSTGWSDNNNVTFNPIDKGSYYLIDAGSPSDIITTAVYDLSAYASAEFSLDVASFQSGTYNQAKIEISFNGGSTFTQTEVSTTTTGSSYIDGGTFTLNSVTNQVQIRISNNGTSGRGVRLRDLVLTAFGIAGPTTYSVTYDGNDNTGGATPTDSNAYDSGDTVTILGNTGSLVNTCNTFNGWNTEADGSGTFYVATDTFNITANTTLYAQWLPTGNTVTFNSNGGTGTMSPQINCVAENLTANTFTNAGFTFNSWNTASDGSGTTYADGASYSFASDITLYAQWDVFVGPCHTEDFSAIGSISAYSSGTWSGEGGTWAATDARSDRTINGKAITIRNGTLTSPSFSDGIGDITMTTNLPFSDSNGNLIVKINGSTVGTIPYSSSVQTTTISNINIGGTIIITVESNNSARISIDDLNWTCYSAIPEPEIEILGNSTEIADGDTTPNTADDTDFGNVAVAGGTNANVFTIYNTGTADLDITSIASSNATEYAVSGTTLGIINPGNFVTFTVTFDPNTIGPRTSTITVISDDANEATYTFDITGNGTNSNQSTIINNTTYSTTAPEFNINVEYINFINASATAIGKFIPMKLKIQDGPDADGFDTKLTDMSFTVEDIANVNHLAMIKTAILTTTGGTPLATASKVGNELVFSGMNSASLTAGDDGEQIFHLRVSIDETQVIDNTKLVFKVTSATADASGSSFAATDASGAETDTSNNNRNRLNVRADRLAFTTQPSDTSLNTNLNTFNISAVDAYGNIDSDTSLGIDLTTSGTGMSSSSPYNLINGELAISDVQFNISQTNIYLTATTTGLAVGNSINSTNFDILDVAVGTYRTTSNGTWPSGTATWERLTGTGWNAATPAANTNDLLIIRHTITSRASFAAPAPLRTSMIVQSGGSFDDGHNSTFRSLLIQSGGEFIASDSAVDIDPTGTLTVENGGLLVINSSTLNHGDGLFDGTENFEPNSTVEVRQYDNDTSPGEDDLIDSDSAISLNSEGYYFGNLFINFTFNLPSNDKAFTLVGLPGTQKLCSGDLTINNNTTTEQVQLINRNTNVEIGGNVIVTKNKFSFGTIGSSNVTHTVKGNVIVNGTGAIIDLNTTSSGSGSVLVNIEGDLIGIEGTLTSTDGDCGIAFTGSTLQNMNVDNSVPYKNINTFVKNNAEVQLLNNNLKLNNSSTFTVEDGGSFNFNWAIDNITPLLITNGGSGSNTFDSEEGSILKITHPDGLIKNTANAGNVQLSVSNKTFKQAATFHYIGKENQETGDALTVGSSIKNVYVNLIDNTKELRLTNRTGISNGGKLEIQRGIVIGEEAGVNDKDFYGSGRLVMTGGEYQISTITNNPSSDYLPQLSGYINYSLTDGTVHLNGSHSIQILSGLPTYYNLDYSGTNTLATEPPLPPQPYNYKGVSTAVDIVNNVTITGDAIVDIENNTFGGSTTNLIMEDNARFITAGTGTKPDATGNYTLEPNTTIEFNNNNNNTGLEEIRLTNPVPNYANIVVSGSNVGTVALGTGANSFIQFQPNGSFTVTGDGTFKHSNSFGFSGLSNTAISNTNNPTIELLDESTINYAGANQIITPITTSEYKNLTISGSETKSLGHPTDILVGENLNVLSSTLNIQTDEAITVDESVNVNDAASFKINNSGSLIQINDASVNTGKISMIRQASIKNLDYVYWSSPITGFNVSDITATGHIYKWDPTVINTLGTHGNWVSAVNEIMEVGKGYIVRAPNGQTAPPAAGDLNFTNTFYTSDTGLSVPNNGEIIVEIKRGNNVTSDNDIDDNWNLIGNPYPSAISADEFLNNNAALLSNIDGYLNIWKHGLGLDSTIPPFYQNFALSYHQSDYFYYNSVGDTDGPSGFNGYIAAGQSFMVNMVDGANAATGTVVFNNSMRDKGYTNNQFFRSSENATSPEEKHRIWLDLITPETPTNRILVGYLEGATTANDRMFDAKLSLEESTDALYSIISDNSYIIQGRALPFVDTDVIPLGLKVSQMGNYTIAIGAVDGLFESENQIIYLKDNTLNFTHNLTNQPYEFTSETGEFNDRFQIVFTQSTLSIDDNIIDANAVTITEFQNGDVQIKVGKTHTIKHVAIIDVTGRIIYNLPGHDSTEVYDLSKLSQAAYIAKITLSNGQVISKKAIKKH
ncbi:choice-of-anchor D domain-containing protein [Winogradskyella pacifica]|uniref:choice-of-anchor D domain-containing protein n=1 Tax=Winogradskyella pacifica TaxID=664642 RepID=UPI0015C71729|nr:choice-of-anchor D domain-containing protein [Winogradskyella pacifica]